MSSNQAINNLMAGIINGEVEVVDLAQPLNESTPVIQLPEPFKNTGGFRYIQLSQYDDAGPAWYWNDFVAGEHCGTHFDAPNHWISGKEGDSVDSMPAKNMIGEACVIDISQQSAENPDYCLTVADIVAYEDKYGRIPDHSWVILYTGWGKYGQDPEKFFNIGEDGMPHTPGTTVEASIFLAQERNILGFGVETVGTDAGIAATFDPPFPNHFYMHQANRYGLAQLANVDQLPPRGSVIIATPLKITNGSGSPIRPIALVPKK
ncbi:cyclase family protein [Ammoniphilus sp. CFH 90114]|uniref:cyclase family protein n=1 Tax=Ammoniphilus sp. CFH 90114 TaxID=2493665 RepID=UPI00100F4F40|nr:cyclase family protein [Ammoniphilus sp. CFH 90114]RXT08026.1 cyclase family protein [Ammoniphilus sp. CFH 90114]